MVVRRTDIAIVGGGLAGGLIAAALVRARPDQAVTLIEAGPVLGGNHRWSWFASDISADGRALLDPFTYTMWEDGYEVRFPGHTRELSTPYRSLASTDFDAALRRLLPADAILTGTPVNAVDAQGVTLEGGARIASGAVIDCRGHMPSPHLTGGWQVFYGRHIRTAAPHRLTRPIIMDAAVEQFGAYRFVYVLPLAEDEIFVEDTYYADSPLLARATLSSRVDIYCKQHGWTGAMLGEETGVLPVIAGGDFSAFQKAHDVPGVARAGTRGGFSHPLTSYSFPLAVETALAVAAAPDLSGPALAGLLSDRAVQHWQATGFYRLLGKMLFGAAVPDHRWQIFERFYALPEGLIERFYAGRSTRLDQARVLIGKPPVPIGRAIGALLSPGAPMSDHEPPKDVAA